MEFRAGTRPSILLAYRGFRKVQLPVGMRRRLTHKRGLPQARKTRVKRRQSIGPTIGLMQTDELLPRNWLKGGDCDGIRALLCGAAHNLRLIQAQARVFLLALIALIVRGRIGDAPTRQHLSALETSWGRVLSDDSAQALTAPGRLVHWTHGTAPSART